MFDNKICCSNQKVIIQTINLFETREKQLHKHRIFALFCMKIVRMNSCPFLCVHFEKLGEKNLFVYYQYRNWHKKIILILWILLREQQTIEFLLIPRENSQQQVTISFYSNYPNSYKFAVHKSMIHRALSILIEPKFPEREFNKIVPGLLLRPTDLRKNPQE